MTEASARFSEVATWRSSLGMEPMKPEAAARMARCPLLHVSLAAVLMLAACGARTPLGSADDVGAAELVEADSTATLTWWLSSPVKEPAWLPSWVTSPAMRVSTAMAR